MRFHIGTAALAVIAGQRSAGRHRATHRFPFDRSGRRGKRTGGVGRNDGAVRRDIAARTPRIGHRNLALQDRCAGLRQRGPDRHDRRRPPRPASAHGGARRVRASPAGSVLSGSSLMSVLFAAQAQSCMIGKRPRVRVSARDSAAPDLRADLPGGSHLRKRGLSPGDASGTRPFPRCDRAGGRRRGRRSFSPRRGAIPRSSR